MNRALLASLSCLAVLTIGTVIATERPDLLPAALQPPEPAIQVFMVGDGQAVAELRKAVSRDRVLVDNPDALAFVEERIVGTDADAVSEALNQAGWVDRELDIFTISPKDWLRARSSGTPQQSVHPDRLARLQQIAKQPTLSPGEQVLVLQAMNEGIAF